MRATWKTWSTIGVLAVAATIAAAHSRADGRHRGGFLLGRIEGGVAQLDLPKEKRQEVDAILAKARADREALREPLRTAREQIRTELDQPAPSLDAVLAQADSIGALESRARKSELQALVEVRKLLSAEQWQKLREHAGPPHRGGPPPGA